MSDYFSLPLKRFNTSDHDTGKLSDVLVHMTDTSSPIGTTRLSVTQTAVSSPTLHVSNQGLAGEVVVNCMRVEYTFETPRGGPAPANGSGDDDPHVGEVRARWVERLAQELEIALLDGANAQTIQDARNPDDVEALLPHIDSDTSLFSTSISAFDAGYESDVSDAGNTSFGLSASYSSSTFSPSSSLYISSSSSGALTDLSLSSHSSESFGSLGSSYSWQDIASEECYPRSQGLATIEDRLESATFSSRSSGSESKKVQPGLVAGLPNASDPETLEAERLSSTLDHTPRLAISKSPGVFPTPILAASWLIDASDVTHAPNVVATHEPGVDTASGPPATGCQVRSNTVNDVDLLFDEAGTSGTTTPVDSPTLDNAAAAGCVNGPLARPSLGERRTSSQLGKRKREDEAKAEVAPDNAQPVLQSLQPSRRDCSEPPAKRLKLESAASFAGVRPTLATRRSGQGWQLKRSASFALRRREERTRGINDIPAADRLAVRSAVQIAPCMA